MMCKRMHYDTNTNLPGNPNNDNNSDSDDNSYSTHTEKKKITQKNNAIGHLPPELLKFVNNDTYSLLIKGKPGTGKTTLALTLMDNLNYDGNYFYISTRLSIRQLLYFYPWITKFTLNNESKHEYKFEDARLDEPESLFERITNQLMDVKSPIIIIDTWDTIALFMDRESRLNNERVLQIWRERSGAKLIFLSESSDLTLLDSIVDGVITLRQESKKSFTCRELFFNKLRGIPIGCPRYCFSLYNGIFFALDSSSDLNLIERFKNNELKHSGFDFKETTDLPNDKTKPYQSPNTFLNEIINGSNIVTMEFDSRIPDELILSVLFRTIFSWVVSAKPVFINNFEWGFYSILKKILLFFVHPEKADDLLLNEKLDFFKIYKEYVAKNEQNSSSKENKSNLDEFEISVNKIIPTVYKNNNKNTNRHDVLNIIDGNNTKNLISDFKFIDRIKRIHNIHNLVIIKNRLSKDYDTNNNNVLLSEGNYFKIYLRGNNIIIKSIGPSKQIYGAFNQNDDLFVDWYPLI
jgi:KaiC/GvpD/RAD55 family RecA-like ATPase